MASQHPDISLALQRARLVNPISEKPPKKTRRTFATELERKQAHDETARKSAQSRIQLGDKWQEWERQRMLCSIKETKEFVAHLLAVHVGWCPRLCQTLDMLAEHPDPLLDLHGDVLVNLVSGKPQKKTRRTFTTDIERKQAQAEGVRKSAQSRITLGDDWQEWERQRMLCGIKDTKEFVAHLLAIHVGQCPRLCQVSASGLAVSGEPENQTNNVNAVASSKLIGGPRDDPRRVNICSKLQWCQPCQRAFSDTEIKNHIFSHFRGKVVHCAQCVEGFPTEQLVEEHVLTHMGLTMNVLQTKGVKMKHFDPTLNAGAKGQSDEASTSIRKPMKMTVRKAGTDQYMNQMTVAFTFSTGFPSSMNTLRQNIVRTQDEPTEHEAGQIYECTPCGKVFQTEWALKRHENVHRFYICDRCGKQYQSQYSLKNHMYKHTGLWPYTCATCGQGCISESQLLSHVVIHSGVHSHICETCGKGFLTGAYLRLHQATHTADRPFKCNICDMAFRLKRNANIHERTHNAQRNHECTVCGLGFKTRGTLKTHTRRHSDKRNHKCSTCGKTFDAKGSVDRHMLTHTQQRPHECEVCGNRFQQRGHLRTHMMGHTGDWSHKCGLCGKGYGNPGHLSKHMKNKHGSN